MADPRFFTAFFMYATCMVVSCMVLGTNPAAAVGINGVERRVAVADVVVGLVVYKYVSSINLRPVCNQPTLINEGAPTLTIQPSTNIVIAKYLKILMRLA